VSVDIWWISGVGGDSSASYPEEEENEEPDKLRGERVDVTMLKPAVDRTGDERCPKEREDTCCKKFDDDGVIELHSIVQWIETG